VTTILTDGGPSALTSSPGRLAVWSIGGPTAILDLDGVRFLTDPTFDPPGEHPVGRRVLTKTAGPAVAPGEIGAIDAVLLSHHQHPDNLDRSGRAFLERTPLVLTTPSAAEAIGGVARSLTPWDHVDLARPAGGSVRVTAVPARHGPPGTEHLTGEVTGFVLSADGLPTVYVSGDNASLEIVGEIAARLGPLDVAVLFAGAAQTPLLGDAYLTLTSTMAAEAAGIVGAGAVVPVHFDGWGHYTEGADSLRAAFAEAGLSGRLVLLEPGEAAVLPVGSQDADSAGSPVPRR